jgi:hypothetical protein
LSRKLSNEALHCALVKIALGPRGKRTPKNHGFRHLPFVLSALSRSTEQVVGRGH